MFTGIKAICEHGKIGLHVGPIKEGRVFASHKEMEPSCIQYTTLEVCKHFLQQICFILERSHKVCCKY